MDYGWLNEDALFHLNQSALEGRSETVENFLHDEQCNTPCWSCC